MVDLVTTANYKTYSGITNTAKDTVIDQLVASVSVLVKSYCGISFLDYAATAKTEYFNIDDDFTTDIFLDEMPVLVITSVKERETQSVAYTELYTAGASDGYDYIVQKELGIISRTTSGGYTNFKQGARSVEVVYTAGYADLPEDLKLAIYDLITYYLKDEHKQRRSIVNSSITNQGTSSVDGSSNFPDHITRVLDLYRFNT